MAAVMLSILLASLALHAPVLAQQTGCIVNYDPNTNYFPSAYTDEPFALPLGQTVVTTANDFTVQYASSYKVVKNTFDDTTYVLYQCGAPKPKASDFPAGARFFEIPLTGYAVDTTVGVPYVELLGQVGLLKQTSEYVVAPCLQKALADGSVTAFNSSDPYTGPVFSGDTLLKPFPMNYVSFDTSTDPGALKRAEWIKFMAVFFNQEARASEVYSQIETSYGCLKGSVANVATKPVVAWLSFYNGTWTASSAVYKLEYVTDAGGENPAKAYLRTYDLSKETDVTAFKAFLGTLDVIVDETYLPEGPAAYSIEAFTTNAGISVTESYRFLTTQNVWSMYGRVTGAPLFSTGWYEGAIAQPQLVLQQLISILHPDIAAATQGGFFYNVAKGDFVTVSAADCTGDASVPVNPTIPMCSIAGPSNSTTGGKAAGAAPPVLGLLSAALVAAAAMLV